MFMFSFSFPFSSSDMQTTDILNNENPKERREDDAVLTIP